MASHLPREPRTVPGNRSQTLRAGAPAPFYREGLAGDAGLRPRSQSRRAFAFRGVLSPVQSKGQGTRVSVQKGGVQRPWETGTALGVGAWLRAPPSASAPGLRSAPLPNSWRSCPGKGESAFGSLTRPDSSKISLFVSRWRGFRRSLERIWNWAALGSFSRPGGPKATGLPRSESLGS